MDLMDRASNARQTLQRTRLEDKMQDATRESERLRMENEALRETARRDRNEADRLLDVIEHAGALTAAGRRHRVRGALFLGAVAAGAYVMGTKAGRGRYEQLAAWWRKTRSTGARRLADVRDELADDGAFDGPSAASGAPSVAGTVRV